MSTFDDVVALRATIAAVIGSTSFFAANLTLGLVAAPAALLPYEGQKAKESDDGVARGFKLVYESGAILGPVTALSTCAGYLYAARRSSTTHQQNCLYAAAGCAVGVVPFTLVFMKHVNDELLGRASGQGRRRLPQDSYTLVQKWTKLATVRALIALAAAFCGAASVLG